MKKQILYTAEAPAPIGPYSQAVRVGRMYYFSGQIALDPASGDLIKESIEDETRQVMNNIRALLQNAGLDFKNVVKTSIFIKNMDDFGRINTVYGEFFSGDFPARETVEVARLPKDVNVEISITAYSPRKKKKNK
jgi:2-iminobutanoate/2-iminopropanoate deaminase